MAATIPTHDVPRKRKRKVTFVAALLVLAASAGAYSWWSSTGSGTGSATTGQASAITVNQTSTVTGLAPGKPAQALSGDFTNTTNGGGSVYINSVTVSISSVTKAVGAPAGTCDATDYTVTGSPVTVNANVPAGTGVGSWSGASVAFNNKASNQDACKGATVNFAYTAN